MRFQEPMGTKINDGQTDESVSHLPVIDTHSDEIDGYIDAQGNAVKLKKLTGAFEDDSSHIQKNASEDELLPYFEYQPSPVLTEPDPSPLSRIVKSPPPPIVIEEPEEEESVEVVEKVEAEHQVLESFYI